MKKEIVLSFFLLIFNLAVGQGVDPKLTGSWQGSEKDNQRKNLEKHWIMHRFEDGTFVLLFTTIEDGLVDSFAEKGKWWIENGLFHEYHNNSKMTDIYSYEILDPEHVKFKSKSLALEHENKDYQFIDTKIPDDSL